MDTVFITMWLQNASIPVAAHLSDMEVGKKYYSADGLHFDGFNLENPFLLKI